MNFASPWMLLGLLGLALPILAHLLGRREARRIPFAATRFLDASEPRVARRRQLRDRPLLWLRLLILAALVTALARPFVRAPAQVTVYGATHDAVIILDDSASMRLRVEGTRALDEAVERAREIDAALAPGSRVAWITSDPHGREDALDLPQGARVEALAAWLDAKAVPHAHPLADALDRAIATLGPEKGRPRVVYALSDATAGGLPSLPATLPGEIALIPIEVGASEAPVEHVGLGVPSWTPAPELDPRALRIKVPVQRHAGRDEIQVELVLEIDGREEARTQVGLAPDAVQEVEFTHTLMGESPAAAATLRLEGLDDALPIDDRRDLWLDAESATRIAVVNGDPSERREFDEVYFLVTAIRAADPAGRIRVRGWAPEQLAAAVSEAEAAGREPLEDIDLLVLANVPAPDAPLARALQARVEAGMGLWISVGDRVETQAYNSALGELLPLRLRGPSFAGTAPGRSEARVEGLAPTHLSHPAFAGQSEDLDLASTRTRRLFLLEPDASRDTDLALSFASGAPALITRRFGRGRVALSTTSLDRDWSDLALRAGFVPLVDQMVRWLAGRAGAASEELHWVGDAVELEGSRDWVVRAPDGVERPVAAAREPGDASRFSDTRQVGLYRARPAGRESGEGELEADARRFVVAVDPSESDTRTQPIPHVELDDAVPVEGQRPQWRLLLALAALALALESWLRTRRESAKA